MEVEITRLKIRTTQQLEFMANKKATYKIITRLPPRILIKSNGCKTFIVDYKINILLKIYRSSDESLAPTEICRGLENVSSSKGLTIRGCSGSER